MHTARRRERHSAARDAHRGFRLDALAHRAAVAHLHRASRNRHIAISLDARSVVGRAVVLRSVGSAAVSARHVAQLISTRRATRAVAIADAIINVRAARWRTERSTLNSIRRATASAARGIVVALEVVSARGGRTKVVVVERERLIVVSLRHRARKLSHLRAAAVVEVKVLPSIVGAAAAHAAPAALAARGQTDVNAVGSRRCSRRRRARLSRATRAVGRDVNSGRGILLIDSDSTVSVQTSAASSRAFHCHRAATHRDVARRLDSRRITDVVLFNYDAARLSNRHHAAANLNIALSLDTLSSIVRRRDSKRAAADDGLARVFLVGFNVVIVVKRIIHLNSIVARARNAHRARALLKVLVNMDAIARSTRHNQTARKRIFQQHIFIALKSMARQARDIQRARALHLRVTLDVERSLVRTASSVRERVRAVYHQVNALTILDVNSRTARGIGQRQRVELHRGLVFTVHHELPVSARTAQRISHLAHILVEQNALLNAHKRIAHSSINVVSHVTRNLHRSRRAIVNHRNAIIYHLRVVNVHLVHLRKREVLVHDSKRSAVSKRHVARLSRRKLIRHAAHTHIQRLSHRSQAYQHEGNERNNLFHFIVWLF